MIYFATFLFVVIFCKFLIGFLNKINMLDHPNTRSNHQLPTPRGGGIAIMLAIVLAYWWGDAKTQELNIILACAVGLAIINFLDDKFNISIIWRFAFELIACIIVVSGIDNELLILKNYLPPLLEKSIMVIALLWFTNNFNFMDGIDGIAGAQSIHMALNVALLSFLHPLELTHISLIIAAASAGFLVWNWQRAKIFMGDVASIPLGFIFGCFLLKIATHGMLLTSIIIALYFIADGLITLLRRLFNKEKIWQSHSKHFYQRAVRAGASHQSVVLKIILCNCFLTIAALLSVNFPIAATIMATTVITLLLRCLKCVPF
jgi:UDP-N-acetylmuramyl pentapeptide phosphotransferase/UDP-N-acetylglucosamine-1-phosphate transferase